MRNPDVAASAAGEVPGQVEVGGPSEGSSFIDPVVRTVGLTAVLMLTIAIVICAFCAVVGVVSVLFIEAGIVPADFYREPVSTAIGILLGSIVLTALVSACMEYTFVRPLKRMTKAMNELAQGNFDARREPTGLLRVREVEEFTHSFNMAAQELSGTELMRSNDSAPDWLTH